MIIKENKNTCNPKSAKEGKKKKKCNKSRLLPT
jgi:hypothetical protein